MEARHYIRLNNAKVKCTLCPVDCEIKPQKMGICMGRENQDGVLVAVNYGNAIALHLDPVEKKPLYHFYPGRDILSIGQNGCNLQCPFCQNWQIARGDGRKGNYISPEKLASIALDYGSIGVAYTYTEPLVWFEYVFDSAKLIRQQGGVTVLVTNGHLYEEPFREILTVIDALNIDVKAFDESFYKRQCKGKMEPVLRNVEIAHKMGKMVEVTYLVIPTLNDSEDRIIEMVDWLSGISPDIPLHFSRYYPQYKASYPPTPPSTLFRFREIALNKLNFVYTGNIVDVESSTTYCPKCQSALIRRNGYTTKVVGLEGNRCTNCHAQIHIVN